jgi:hypothetical protein
VFAFRFSGDDSNGVSTTVKTFKTKKARQSKLGKGL